jgi:hypothetical protein
MLLYLKTLRERGFINDFQWKKKNRSTLNKHFFGNTIPLQTVYLIGGWCTTGPMRNKLINQIKKAVSTIDGKQAKL